MNNYFNGNTNICSTNGHTNFESDKDIIRHVVK